MFSLLKICTCLAYLFKMGLAEYDMGSEVLQSDVSSRIPKLFHLFPYHGLKAGFTSSRCTTSTGECGRCLSRKQCLGVEGGNPTDTKCPNNNGICCLIKLSWNQPEYGVVTVKHNLSHIVTSTRLPSHGLFEIPRQKGVCQLRLDFKEFSLSPANDNGNCGMDTMTIIGADNLNPPLELCGRGSTEPIYLHYGASDVIAVDMDIMSASSRHDILITMIKGDSTERAPDGCTQYYTQQRGDVRSFNFPDQQLNNQHYSVCIQANRGSQSIAWSTCNNPLTDFFISGGDPGTRHSYCIGDRVTIPGSVNGSYCGGIFDEEVHTSAKPFALYVNFDHLEMTPPPTGPLQPNGCPAGFQCVDGFNDPIIPVPTDSICPGECSVNVGDPFNGIIQDRLNTGFCLRFRKV